MHLKRSWLISGTAVAGLVLAFNNCDGFSALKLNPETGASQSLTDVQVDSQTSAEFWDQARDRGVRTMSSGTALEPGADTCEIVGDFPIRTHFRNGVGPSPGGVDVPELFNKNIEQEVARGQALVRVYSNGYTPRHANYLEDNHDSQVFSDDTIKSALRHLCAAGTLRFRFRRSSTMAIRSTTSSQRRRACTRRFDKLTRRTLAVRLVCCGMVVERPLPTRYQMMLTATSVTLLGS